MPGNRKEIKSGKGGTLAQRIGKLPEVLAYLPKADRRPSILCGPNIPQPLHGLAPRVVLGINWWNHERRKAYESTRHRCLACGVPKYCASYHQWLEAHETYSIDYAKGLAVYTGSVPLCHLCHNYIHDGRLQALLDQGKIHHAKYVAIIQHGDQVLRDAKLTRPTIEQRAIALSQIECAPWEQWRMSVNGVEYEPLYKTLEEWAAHREQL